MVGAVIWQDSDKLGPAIPLATVRLVGRS